MKVEAHVGRGQQAQDEHCRGARLVGCQGAGVPELAGIQASGAYEGPGGSPDLADATVRALTVLSETKSGVPRVRRL